MDKMLPLFVISACLALALICSAPLPACAQEGSASATAPAPSAHKNVQGQHAGGKKINSRATRREHRQKEKNSGGIHAPAWAFGGGGQSRDAWRQGVNTDDLQKHAIGEELSKDKSVNTADSINSALDGPQAKKEHKSGLALSVGQDDSDWRKKGQHEIEADENVPMQSRHVLRAYADVDAGDDLSIKLGPELILRDEQHERAAANKQPESALGLGMQFKLDF